MGRVNSFDLVVIGSIIGFVAAILMTMAGLYFHDRWITSIGLLGAIFFGAAIAYVGMTL